MEYAGPKVDIYPLPAIIFFHPTSRPGQTIIHPLLAFCRVLATFRQQVVVDHDYEYEVQFREKYKPSSTTMAYSLSDFLTY